MINKETQVRKRKSYLLFQNIATSIKNDSIEKVLDTVFSLLDRRYFGSQTNSNYARESLDLLKKDLHDPIS